jgi:hypothetical protein
LAGTGIASLEPRRWTVYLDTEDDMQRAINYVEQNPQKEGKPLQRWSFVLPYES